MAYICTIPYKYWYMHTVTPNPPHYSAIDNFYISSRSNNLIFIS